MANNTAIVPSQEKHEVAAEPMKFYEYAVREFQKQTISGDISDYQKRLLQGYQVGISRALTMAEEARQGKNASNSNHSYDNTLPVTWSNINMPQLAIDIINYSKLGLDMMQPNMLNALPFKNKKTGKYDVVFIKGYNGIQYIAEKYAVEKPVNITTELVYETDRFKPIKKSIGNNVESYEFDITNPFERGKVIGGFGYIEYSDPKKNKLVIMTMKDIEKRKPQYASAEFWGGSKTVYKDGKKDGTEEVEGWFEEMCMKTLKREVYSPKYIPIDPGKIDDSYQYMKSAEMRYVEMETQAAIEENANKEEFELPAESYQEKEVVQEAKVEHQVKSSPVAEDDSEPDWMQ